MQPDATAGDEDDAEDADPDFEEEELEDDTDDDDDDDDDEEEDEEMPRYGSSSGLGYLPRAASSELFGDQEIGPGAQRIPPSFRFCVV